MTQAKNTTVTAGSIQVYTVPTQQQPHESDGTAIWDKTTMVLVNLSSGDTTAFGFSYTVPAAAHIAQELIEKDILGKDPFDIHALHLAMDIRVRNMGRPGLVSTAIAAVDVALWDLKARLLGLSLLDLLGKTRAEVAGYGSGGFTSYSQSQLVDQLTCWAGEGLKAVKMKIGRHPDQDVARVEAVQRALDGKATLYVDANGAYSRKQALHKAMQFADLGVTWFEEPVSSDDREGLHLMVERAPDIMDIAAGEYSYTLDDARLLIDYEAVDVMQADVTRCGGVTNFMKIGAMCDAYHLPYSGHTSPSIHQHVCCAAVKAVNVEYFHDHVRIEHMFFDGAATAKNGMLRPDTSAPGLGLILKTQDAAKYLKSEMTCDKS